MGEGPVAAYHTKYYYNVLELGTFAAGEHVLALHLYYQGLVNRVWNSGDLRLPLRRSCGMKGKGDTGFFLLFENGLL